MQSNRIMNTIIQLRKFAAATVSSDIKKVINQLNTGLQRYYELQQSKDLNENEKKQLESYNEWISKYKNYIAKNWRDYLEILHKYNTGEVLSDEEENQKKIMEDLLELDEKIIVDESGLNLDQYSGESLTKNELEIYQKYMNNDDFVTIITQNPLFPSFFKKEIKKTPLTRGFIVDKLTEVNTYLREHKAEFEAYKGIIETTEQFVQAYKQDEYTKNVKESSSQNLKNKELELTAKIQELQAENKKLNDELDEPYDKDHEEEGTCRLQISYLDEPDIRGADLLYIVGNNLDKYNKQKEQANERKDNIENEINQLEKLIKDSSDNIDANSASTYKEEARAKKSLAQNSQNNLLLLDELKAKRAEFMVQIGRLDKCIRIAEQIQNAVESNILQKNEDDKYWYNYTDVLKAAKEYAQIYKHTLLDPETAVKNYTWPILDDFIKNCVSFRDKENTIQQNNKSISTYENALLTNKRQQAQIRSELNQININLEANKESMEQAQNRQNSYEYEEQSELVTYYISMQEYRRQLLILQQAYLLTSTGREKNFNEQEKINKLLNSKKLLEQTLDNIKIDPNASTYKRTLDEAQLQKTRTKLSQINNALNELQSTITQKRTGVDIHSIDVEKVAKRIIDRITSSKSSLLNVLLNQSIDQFVYKYLENNNFVTPKLKQQVNLLHYYLSDDDKKSENIHIQDIQYFVDHNNNRQLLADMVQPLINEQKDNIVQQFFQVLKADYKKIYIAYGVRYLNKSDNLFVVNVRDDENEPYTYKQGPFTQEQIRDKYKLDKNETIAIRKKFFIIDNNDTRIQVQIITDTPTGQELLDALNNVYTQIMLDDQGNPIVDIFKQVKKHIIEYIRNRLREKAFSICNNRGNNFYSILLAAEANDLIKQAIDLKSLANYCITKHEASQDANTLLTNANITTLKDSIIEHLCNICDTDNKYVMFHRFLQAHNIATNDIDDENSTQLEKSYNKPLKIFEDELQKAIKRRIALCMQEYKIRNPTGYQKLINRVVTNTSSQYYDQLNGTTNPDGTVASKGLISEIKDMETKLKESIDEIKNNLIEQVNNTKSKLYENKIDRDDVEAYMPNVIIMLQQRDPINALTNKKNKLYDSKMPGTKISKEYYIYDYLVNTNNMKKIIDKYHTQYNNYMELKKQCSKIQNYIDTTNKYMPHINTILIELNDLNDQLFGKLNNPIAICLQYKRLRDLEAKTPLSTTEKTELQKLRAANIQEKVKNATAATFQQTFVNKINKSNYNQCGLYGQLKYYKIIMDECDEIIKKLDKSNNENEKEKTEYENTKKEYEQNYNNIDIKIRNILTRIQSLSIQAEEYKNSSENMSSAEIVDSNPTGSGKNKSSNENLTNSVSYDEAANSQLFNVVTDLLRVTIGVDNREKLITNNNDNINNESNQADRHLQQDQDLRDFIKGFTQMKSKETFNLTEDNGWLHDSESQGKYYRTYKFDNPNEISKEDIDVENSLGKDLDKKLN